MGQYYLTNSFHNTQVKLTENQHERVLQLENTPIERWTSADKQFCKRIHDKLCGSATCECSGTFGYR